MAHPRRIRSIAIASAALLLLGATGSAVAAPAPPVTATLSVDASCLLTVTAVRSAKVDQIFVGWYEADYVNSIPGLGPFVATSDWPSTVPGVSSAKGKVVTFKFGPIGADTATHDWWPLVQPYLNGVALPQVTTNHLSTTCYVPSPA
jgi:hypothetical protein